MTNIKNFYEKLDPGDRTAADALIAADVASMPWRPLVNLENPSVKTPQQLAYASEADVLLYGGAAGGGKSDLICGLATTAHKQSLILRREGKQLAAVIDRLGQILRSRDGFNSQRGRWTLDHSRFIDLGGCVDAGSEQSWQGRPHDLVALDEVAQFLESQFRFLVTWCRSADPRQRCRVVAASNPPGTAEGGWVKQYWGAWLDPGYANPAEPGELRWFVSDADGNDLEVDGPAPVEIAGDLVQPKSRTFIPSLVQDNPYLRDTYTATLQALPEPLRSQLLKGDFLAGGEDSPWQVIPTEWIRISQERWQSEPRPKVRLDAIGCDPSRGGRDQTVLAKRFGDWFDQLVCLPGQSVPDGPSAAALVVANLKDGAPVFLDVIGIGSSVYDHLKDNGINVIGVNASASGHGRDRSGKLSFTNKRAELMWHLREALEPDNLHGILLPPDAKLLADLAAARWRLTAQGILIESKTDIVKRLGRSPDRADAVALALCEGRRLRDRRPPVQARGRGFSFGPASHQQPRSSWP